MNVVASRPATGDLSFRYPSPTAEDLPRLSRLAFDVSATACGACRNYHVMWPYLRAAGANGNGPEHCFDEHRLLLAKLAEGRADVRWLVPGSADAGLLALVHAAAGETPDARHTVTIVDQCRTPLALCEDFARSVGRRVEFVESDLLGYAPEGQFDVIFLHHVIMFFGEGERLALLRRMNDWLAPEGRIVAAVNFERPRLRDARDRQFRNTWREAVVRESIERGEFSAPEDVEVFVRRLHDMRSMQVSKQADLAWRLEDYATLMERAGLAVLETVEMPFSNEELEVFGETQKPRAVIVAGRKLDLQGGRTPQP